MTTATLPLSLQQQYETEFARSQQLAERARSIFPGGVTHELRGMQPFPPYIDRAQGAYKWSVEGHRLIDYWSGHGALLLGHSHPDIVAAVQRQMERATHPGGCHELELEWGEWVQQLIPSAERVRFVSSGTEATLMALRLARIFTGKEKILKFNGHFHGWHDAVMPGAYAPHDPPPVPGIPLQVQDHTVVLPPNDIAAVEAALANDPEIGCVILEPTGGHWGLVPIRGEFLRQLRDVTRRYNRLLIFDEVITGFRIHPSGAQGHFGIMPDLTTLAKIVAGGLPGGCVAGREEILAPIASRPGKPKMRHPGTFNANPLSASAGITALKLVSTGEPCRHANEMGRRLRRQLNELFARRDLPWVCYGEFSFFRLIPGYRGPRPTSDDFIPFGGSFEELERPRDPRLVHSFRCAMLLHGVDLPALGGFLMATHTPADIDHTVQAVGRAVEMLASAGLV